LQWVQTSPNVPTWQTTFALLCTGLIDNAGVNNGTGFTKPFFLAGTAGLDGRKLAAALNGRNLPGVWFRPASWSPIAGFWKDKELSGVELVVFAPERFLAVKTSVEILVAVRNLNPRAISIKADALDRDWGTSTLRQGLTSGAAASEILAQWAASVEKFKTLRERYLLY
jgi:uncharacterized protein YbbC (DUF1343 family)